MTNNIKETLFLLFLAVHLLLTSFVIYRIMLAVESINSHTISINQKVETIDSYTMSINQKMERLYFVLE